MGKPRTHSVPLTYKPKADAVFSGRCCQTIRKGTKYAVGDRLLLFEWTGRPYRSKWGRRLRARVVGCTVLAVNSHVLVWAYEGRWAVWNGGCASNLAAADGIDPPTGEALRDTLKRLNGPDWAGLYQVITWEPEEDEQ